MKLLAKKSLGQHFLNSTHVLEQIVSAAHIQIGDKILEIGPGTGVLTRALLKSGAIVVAVEKDFRAIELLRETFKAEILAERLQLIEGDILEMATEKLFEILHYKMSNRGANLPTTPIGKSSLDTHESSFSIVANIPYYITGAILEKFLEHGPRSEKMILLVQKEVAERIVARDKKESILSISVKVFGSPQLVAKVPPGAFTPPPTVDSAILSITMISDRLFREKSVDISRFFHIVKAGFAHKRKFAIRNLESVALIEDLRSVWEKIGLDPKIRAEDMTVEQWITISATLKTKTI